MLLQDPTNFQLLKNKVKYTYNDLNYEDKAVRMRTTKSNKHTTVQWCASNTVQQCFENRKVVSILLSLTFIKGNKLEQPDSSLNIL